MNFFDNSKLEIVSDSDEDDGTKSQSEAEDKIMTLNRLKLFQRRKKSSL